MPHQLKMTAQNVYGYQCRTMAAKAMIVELAQK